MSKLFSFLARRGRASGGEPWDHRPSIYDHVAAHLDPATGSLTEEGWELPDEERRYAGTELRWVPGALDGALGYHGGSEGSAERAHQVATQVLDIARQNAPAARRSLYALLVEDNLLDYIDEALAEIARSKVPAYPHLHEFAVHLARRAPDRGPVKFAIALLGLIGDEADRELVTLLGRHEELTLYTTVALSNMLAEPEGALWDLARRVEGWGKIHLVRRLAATDSPRLKDWLLREGYRNNIMREYLAYACATGGDLRGALAAETVDDELIESAGDLIEALVMGGPVEDIDDYEDAADVVARYLDLVESRGRGLKHLVAVDVIRHYLMDENWGDEKKRQQRQRNGWDDERRAAAARTAEEILRRPHWPALVEQGLAAEDEGQFYLADRAASALGMDTWSAHWVRLQANPHQSHRWYPVMQRSSPDNIDQIVSLAVDVLPLDQVATGAADKLGLGPGYEIHQCLDAIVPGLGRYPGMGWPLLDACLQSPVVRNRNLVVRVLVQWGRDNWGPEIRPALVQARDVEPVEDVRKRMENTLRGEAPAD